jgi:hypothetical protein
MKTDLIALRIEVVKRAIRFTSCPINKIHFEAELQELQGLTNKPN